MLLCRGRAALCLALSALLVSFMSVARAQGTLKVEEKVDFAGSPNNIRVSNGIVELILATDYGPRIMRYALSGSAVGDNVFATLPDLGAKNDLGQWYIRGGHRLWHAPEAIPRTYVPDNDPVQVVREGDTIKLIQPVEKGTGIQKEMWVTLDPKSSHVTVMHKMTNKGLFAIEIAPWALSAMNKDGIAIFPQEPYQSHEEALLPARPMVLWSYTNLTDPRWMFGQKFITLRQDTKATEAQKIGFQNRQGWSAYWHSTTLFLKRFGYENGKTYPDFGCNNETYTDANFLELESLGPLVKLEPGGAVTHQEDWWLYKSIDLGNGEAGIAAALQSILTETAPPKPK